MNFRDYQNEAAKTAIYKEIEYPFLGLAEECGEVVGLMAKAVRDNNGQLKVYQIDQLQKELGDVLWMLSACALEFGIGLDDVAEANIAKLRDRAARGVISGSGDNR